LKPATRAGGVVAAALALTLAPAMALVGCSLGLNRALIGETTDAAPRESGVGDGRGNDADTGTDGSADTADGSPQPDAAMEAGGEGGTDSSNEASAGPCTQSSQCTSANGCLTGRCVLPAGQCVFDLCPGSMCNGSACNTATNSCGAPTPYTFAAAAIPLTAGIGCASASTCIGASFPFVYVGTTEGVYAVNVANPALATPPIVPVAGIPFFASAIVQSGPRVYFVGSLQASGTSAYMLPIAWIDPPADPTAPLSALSAFVVYPVSSFKSAVAGGTEGLFVESDITAGPQNGLLTAPLPNPTTVALFATPLKLPGENVVGASLASLVTYRFAGATYAANFALVTGAGTAGAANGGETDITAAGFGQVAPGPAFASGPDGTLLFSAAHIQVAQNNYSDVRLGWVYGPASQDAGTGFNSQFTVVTSYAPPAGSGGLDTPILAPLVGPVVWLDPARAMVLAASGPMTATPPCNTGTGTTCAQVVTQASSPPAVLPQSAVLMTPTNATGAASAQSPTTTASFGYVLTADSLTSSTVHIIAPDCPM
jgi:hypothetical protein